MNAGWMQFVAFAEIVHAGTGKLISGTRQRASNRAMTV